MTNPNKMPENKQKTGSRIERYYGRIVIGFVLLTVLLLGVIAYFSFAKTVVTVETSITADSFTIETTVQELQGVIIVTDIDGSIVYSDITPGEQRIGKSTGEVTLINNYTDDQPLVETTRLLSSSGILFRTAESVTIPAGGQVTVPVIADEEGPEGDIGPSTFEVVALWDGLKEQIYGESDSAMRGGSQAVGVVTQTDIANARQELERQVLQQADERFDAEQSSLQQDSLPANPLRIPNAVSIATLATDISPLAGEQAESVSVTETHTIASAIIDEELLEQRIEQALTEQVTNGAPLTQTISLEDAVMTLSDVNTDLTNATVTISFEGDIKSALPAAAQDTTNITNKTADQVREYLTQFDEITSVDVQISPAWSARTPAIAENITIKVE